MIAIRSRVTAKQALENLRYVHMKIGDVQGAGGDVRTMYSNYLNWANEAVRMLGPMVSAEDLDRLVTTKRYWVLRANHPDAFAIHQFLNYEISERVQELEREVQELDSIGKMWQWENGFYVAVVPDTNFLLDYHKDLASIDWHTKMKLPGLAPIMICVPMIVVDELDGLKLSNKKEYGKEPLRKRASKALRMLETHLEKPGDRISLHSGVEYEEERADVFLTMFTDGPSHLPITPHDAEVRDRALTLRPFASHVSIATIDFGMMFKARYEELDVCKFEDVRTSESESGNSRQSQ